MTKKKIKYDRPEHILAEDIMTEEVFAIKPHMTIGDLTHIMLRQGFNGFPVIDEEDALIGIVTFTDLYRLIGTMAITEGVLESTTSIHEAIEDMKTLPVSKIMTTNVKTITPKTTLSQIIEMVVIQKIHTFPVLDKANKVVGILGREDVLNATFSYG